jgi:hypothetical protein
MPEFINEHHVSTSKLILAGVLAIAAVVLGVFLIVMIIAGLSLQNGLNNVAKVQPVFEKLCEVKTGQLNSIYTQTFTSGFKSRVDFPEFKKLYSDNQDFFDNCKGILSRMTLGDMLTGSRISYTNDSQKGETFSFLIRTRGKTLELLMLKKNTSAWLIDQFFIE